MLLSVKKRFLFVANTKTASTSIEQALAPFAETDHGGTPERKHLPLQAALDVYGDVLRGPVPFVKFGVLRDPLDWIMSWFRYRKGNRVEAPLPADLSFAEFWARKDWNLIHPHTGRKMLQRDMFCAPDGAVLADLILPYHRLDDLFAQLCRGLGISARLERHNVSRITRHPELDPDLEREIRRFYAEDYALMDRLDAINATALSRFLPAMPETMAQAQRTSHSSTSALT